MHYMAVHKHTHAILEASRYLAKLVLDCCAALKISPHQFFNTYIIFPCTPGVYEEVRNKHGYKVYLDYSKICGLDDISIK